MHVAQVGRCWISKALLPPHLRMKMRKWSEIHVAGLRTLPYLSMKNPTSALVAWKGVVFHPVTTIAAVVVVVVVVAAAAAAGAGVQSWNLKRKTPQEGQK